MSVDSPPRPLTYEDIEHITDTAHRYEILQGELIVSPNPIPQHAEISSLLGERLVAHVRSHRLGRAFSVPVDVRISPNDVVAPDLCFVSNERTGIIGDKLIEGAPDLVIEILSPSTQQVDRVRKMALYGNGGVREYWLVDPKTRSVRVVGFAGGVATDATVATGSIPSAVLPELPIAVDDIFPAAD